MPELSLVYRAAACAVLSTVVVGCGTRGTTITESEQNLAQLSRLYGVYLSKNQGMSPANVEALKSFAQKSDAAELNARGVTAKDVDAIFASSRDKQPFVYRPPGGAGVPGKESDKVIFYEQTGVNGKRFVAYTTPGKVEEVDATKFKELVPDAR